MIDWVSMVYIFICGAALLLMGLGFGLAAVMPGLDRWSKRFFAAFFGVLLHMKGRARGDAAAHKQTNKERYGLQRSLFSASINGVEKSGDTLAHPLEMAGETP